MTFNFEWHLTETPSLTFPNIKWGTWGGGWSWKLGLQGSRNSIMLMLLVCSLTLDWSKK